MLCNCAEGLHFSAFHYPLAMVFIPHFTAVKQTFKWFCNLTHAAVEPESVRLQNHLQVCLGAVRESIITFQVSKCIKH